MSLSTVLTALVEYVGDVMVNACGRPAPDRVLRYHGTLPHDCCTENGFVVGSWERQYASNEFPNATATGPTPCTGIQVAVVNLRFVTCWPVPDVGPGGVTLADDTWDARAAILADIEDCVTRALVRLSCDPDVADPFVTAVLNATGKGRVRFAEATPIGAGGGCAGVLWRLYAGVRSGPPLSQSLALPPGDMAGGGV